MAAGRIIYLVLLICILYEVKCQGPPKIDSSFKAWGEITQAVKDLPARVQLAFEESYDSERRNAAFIIWIAGKNVSFIKDFNTGQTLRYVERKECALTTEEEWVKSDYPPGLLKYEDHNGTIRFSMKQLFSIPDKFLVEKDVTTVFRDIPARLWRYEIPDQDKKDGSKLSVSSYWSDGKWETSSNEDVAPLGFKVTHKSGDVTNDMKESETIISVFGFVTEVYDYKHFMPVEGVICPGRKQTKQFPNFKNVPALAIHSEMILPDYSEIRYIDTWFNPRSQIARIDLERLRDEDPNEERKVKRYESEISIAKMGVVFKSSIFKEEYTCEIIPYSKYVNDMENLIDVKQKNLSRWTIGKLFGLNGTTYVYMGQTTKRHIACHLFQGVRKDWPEESSNVESLWEWCFNVNMTGSDKAFFRDNEIGLISAQVQILKSDRQDYPEGFRIFHHFYEVSPQNPDIMDAIQFDISPCFPESERRYLQLTLDWKIKEDELPFAENITSDIRFIQRWKAILYKNTGLPPESLRISNMVATIENTTLYVKFAILKVHPGLPDDIRKNQKKAFAAESDLRDNIKAGSVSIQFPVNGKMKTLKGTHLSFQIDPDFRQHTLPPVPPTESDGTTKFPFSLKTEPTREKITATDIHGSIITEETDPPTTTTMKPEPTREKTTATDIYGSIITEGTDPPTTTTKKPEKQKRGINTGHQPGAVAAVSIAMLLVGVSIGSAGTFYKFNGLPACIRR